MAAHSYQKIIPPQDGEKIGIINSRLQIPNRPIIPYIEGDGIGPEITASMKKIVDHAVKKSYNKEKGISWFKVYAGKEAMEKYGSPLPEETLQVLMDYVVSIKGPLETPVGGGQRSLNVAIRQKLDLFSCIRPVRYFKGIPSPVKNPERLDIVIFRENTEDLYAGIEWKANSSEVKSLKGFLSKEFGIIIKPGSGIGLKIMSEEASKRLIRKAIKYAISKKRRSVTLVHKGNIMKYTEGAFRNWGYELAREEFHDAIVTEEELSQSGGEEIPDGKVILKDRIADNMFQQVLIKPEEYDVLAMPNLNGDYLSDACAAQVGGIGIAPGANVGEHVAVFEATHGTAPDIRGKNMANPCSLILSAGLLLEYLGWQEVADRIIRALERTIQNRMLTPDLARYSLDSTSLSTSEFTHAVVENI